MLDMERHLIMALIKDSEHLLQVTAWLLLFQELEYLPQVTAWLRLRDLESTLILVCRNLHLHNHQLLY